MSGTPLASLFSQQQQEQRYSNSDRQNPNSQKLFPCSISRFRAHAFVDLAKMVWLLLLSPHCLTGRIWFPVPTITTSSENISANEAVVVWCPCCNARAK